jgi:uncharacterized membrane protein YkoI
MRTIRFAALVAFAIASSAVAAGAQQTTQHQGHHAKVEETQAQLEKEARVTMAQARALALKTVPGASIKDGEIEREGGKLIYSFDMKTQGKTGIDEVNIDAMTGTVIGNQHETPKAERAEAKADAKAAKAAKAKQ